MLGQQVKTTAANYTVVSVAVERQQWQKVRAGSRDSLLQLGIKNYERSFEIRSFLRQQCHYWEQYNMLFLFLSHRLLSREVSIKTKCTAGYPNKFCSVTQQNSKACKCGKKEGNFAHCVFYGLELRSSALVPVLPEILHVRYADGWVGDAIVDNSIHCHCYRVP